MPLFMINPCPFCGSNNVILSGTAEIDAELHEDQGYLVICKDCGDCSEIWTDPDDAVGQWNKYIPREDLMPEAICTFDEPYCSRCDLDCKKCAYSTYFEDCSEGGVETSDGNQT